MSTIITIGCSFVQGVGVWYEDKEKINQSNRDYHQKKYHVEHMNLQLNNSIGSYLQNKLGYKKFYNFGISGTSIANQLRIWFENPIDVKDETVLVLLFGTYPTRMGQYLGGSVGDVDLLDSFWSYPFNGSDKTERTIEETELDLHLDFIHNIRVFKEYCEVRNWKFEYCLIDDKFPNLYKNEVGIPFPNPFKGFETKLSKEEKCHLSPHPNKIGYYKIYDKFHKWITDNRKDWFVGDNVENSYIGWTINTFTNKGHRIPKDRNRF